MRKFLLCMSAFFLCLTGCVKNTVVVNDIEEREANEIVVFLISRGITAHKVNAKATGIGDNGPPMYSIEVNKKDMTQAMAILNQNGLPRKKGTNLLELFAKQGLMTTEKEETIRYQAGLEQQIANTIRKIDGVIDADVRLSFPPDVNSVTSATPVSSQKVTAAVYVKHQGIMDDPNSHLVPKIKRLVSGSVNGLDINDVTVISDRSRFSDISFTATETALNQPKDYTSIWSIVVANQSLLPFRLLFSTLIAINILLLALLCWILWKCYPILMEQGGLKTLFSLKSNPQNNKPNLENE